MITKREVLDAIARCEIEVGPSALDTSLVPVPRKALHALIEAAKLAQYTDCAFPYREPHYTPPQISTVFSFEDDCWQLMATSHSRTAIAGERIFRAEPWPSIRFSHDSAESAEHDAGILRAYCGLTWRNARAGSGLRKNMHHNDAAGGRIEMQLTQMLNELEAARLEVCLAPSRRRDRREHDMIRVCMSVPVKWYRVLCGKYPSSRGIRRGKFDTKIKRANVLSTLRVMAEGRFTPSKYAPELRRIARGLK